MERLESFDSLNQPSSQFLLLLRFTNGDLPRGCSPLRWPNLSAGAAVSSTEALQLASVRDAGYFFKRVLLLSTLRVSSFGIVRPFVQLPTQRQSFS